jgi:hypothetical protein
MSLCVYLYKVNNLTKNNVYKFGTIENKYMMNNTRLKNSKKSNILKNSNVIFHILTNKITIEADIIDIFKNTFTLHNDENNVLYEGDYTHMINIIYSLVVYDDKNIIHDVKNNHLFADLSNNDDIKINYIYLLQEREFIALNENIYKIGMTQLNNYARFSQYPNNSIMLFQMKCENCVKLEKIIIYILKKNFFRVKEIGNEYFKGDYTKMIQCIYDIIKNEKILTNTTITEKKNKHSKNTLKLIQHNKNIIKEKMIKEYSSDSYAMRENIKYKELHNIMIKIGIDKENTVIFEKFMNIIKNEKEFLKHNNLIKLLKNKTIFDFTNENLVIDITDIKIALIRKIENDNNISILNLNFNEEEPLKMDKLTYKYLKKYFCSRKKQPSNKHDLKVFYTSMLKHLCNEILHSNASNKKINGNLKKITKYHLNIERIKLSLELEKYSNPKIYEEIIYDGLLKILE